MSIIILKLDESQWWYFISGSNSSKLLQRGKKTSYASEVETKFYNVLFKEFKEKWENNCDIIVHSLVR